MDHTDHPGATPPLPTSIKVLAGVSLLSAVTPLVEQGVKQDAVSLVVSVVLGALLIGYISAGVVRARTVRLVLAWLVLSLSLVFGVIGLLLSDGQDVVRALVSVAITAVSLGALERFRHTEWYAWQRTKPSTKVGAPIHGLVAVGVLVGALGGCVDGLDDTVHVSVQVAEQ
jgi:hypothetical protein